MKRFFKTIICLLSFLLISSLALTGGTVFASTSINNVNANEAKLNVKAAITIDQKTGEVLYAKNAAKALPIASMSKLITICLTLQAIKNGKLSWNQKLTPTKNIVKLSNNSDYSNVPLQEKHQYTVKQLYEASLIESANGAVMMLAQAVYGSQENAVNQMRTLLKKWQINGAQIYTTCGLKNGEVGSDAYPGAGKNVENEVPAVGVAKIVDHLLTDYPEVLSTSKLAELDFKDGSTVTKMKNWNWMLKGLSQYDSEYPLDGLKTGTSEKAGACFAGTLKYKGRRLITIVMGAKHVDGTDPSRFVQTKKMLDYVYSNYQLYIYKKGTQLANLKGVKVADGNQKISNLVVKKDSGIWQKTSSTGKLTFSKSEIEAPIKKGQLAGYYLFTNNPSIYSSKGTKLAATVRENIDQANIFVRIWHLFFK